MNTLHISAVYDAFSNTHSNIAFQNEVSWGGTLSSYKINILGRAQKGWYEELFGGGGTTSSMQYPLLKKIPILKTQRSPQKLTMPMYVLVLWLYYIQILHRGKESHIACRSTLEVKLVCTNMMMLRSSHLHSSCLLTHTYILYTVYYMYLVWSTCLNIPA